MRTLTRSTLKPAWRYQRLLTVKLRGRTTTWDRRRGRTLSPGARGAKQTTPHGPLQRLLGVILKSKATLPPAVFADLFYQCRAVSCRDKHPDKANESQD